MSDTAPKPLSANEGIKSSSNFLRGHLAQDVADATTGAISEDSNQLAKFHGLYLQDDRDQRKERTRLKQEKAYGFMLRVRLPGGRCTPQQYLLLDRMGDEVGNGTLRLTTRQTFQFHGIAKGNLKKLVRGLNSVWLDSIAACGDVNRNVMAPPNPERSAVHQRVYELAKNLSDYALPKTRAYHEIWIDDELAAGGEGSGDMGDSLMGSNGSSGSSGTGFQPVDGSAASENPSSESEPMYGPTYLPRKFKIGFAVPPSNDVDIFSQDIGFIAITENNPATNTPQLAGFNVAIGGGMGMSHGNAETFPRLGDIIGFITPDQVNAFSYATITTQRDYGDRANRKHARFKYTIETHGLAFIKSEIEKRSGITLAPARPYKFTTIADDYGWRRATDGTWYNMLFILSGRIKDNLHTALREIAQIHTGDFRLTPSQNLSISGITDAQRPAIEAILEKHDLNNTAAQTGLRLNALSCVALPTCGLALAESERALPEILEKLEPIFTEAGLHDDPVSIRVTGCPNGCARPYLGEIALVGKAPGKYALYLGAEYTGTRLNTLYAQSLTIDETIAQLAPIIRRYAAERHEGEFFGDYCHRAVLTEVAAAK